MEFPPECHRVFGYVDFRVWGAEDQSQPKTLLTRVEAWEKTQNTRPFIFPTAVIPNREGNKLH